MMSAICYLLILISLGSNVDCEKTLPSGMSQHQYCHGCMATMKELLKKLPKNLKGNRDVAVIDELEKICSPSNFVEYHYSPPKTVKACKALLENSEEDIEVALIKNDQADVVAHICNVVGGACEGINLTKEDKDAKYSDIDLTKDGKGETTKSVEIDPSSGKVVKEEKEKKKDNDGKTLSKSSKKKKQKKQKGESVKSTKKSKTKEASSGGQKKGAIHNLNIDINDPESLKRVMSEINKITGQQNAEANKDEL